MKEYKCENCNCTKEEKLYYFNSSFLCKSCFIDILINARKDIISDFLSDNIVEFCEYVDGYII